MQMFGSNGNSVTISSMSAEAARKAYASIKAVQDSTAWVVSNIDYTSDVFKFTVTADSRDTRLNVDYVRTLVGPSSDLSVTDSSVEPDTIAVAVESVANGSMTSLAAAKALLRS